MLGKVLKAGTAAVVLGGLLAGCGCLGGGTGPGQASLTVNVNDVDLACDATSCSFALSIVVANDGFGETEAAPEITVTTPDGVTLTSTTGNPPAEVPWSNPYTCDTPIGTADTCTVPLFVEDASAPFGATLTITASAPGTSVTTTKNVAAV